MFAKEFEIDGQYDGLEGKPYVYLFVSLSGEVFYVGKGLCDRFFRHISGLSVRTEANKRKYTRIREEFASHGAINVIFFPPAGRPHLCSRTLLHQLLPTHVDEQKNTKAVPTYGPSDQHQ